MLFHSRPEYVSGALWAEPRQRDPLADEHGNQECLVEPAIDQRAAMDHANQTRRTTVLRRLMSALVHPDILRRHANPVAKGVKRTLGTARDRRPR